MYHRAIKIFANAVDTYAYRSGNASFSIPYQFFILLGIMIVAGSALLYGAIKLFKTRWVRNIIDKI